MKVIECTCRESVKGDIKIKSQNEFQEPIK